MSTSRPPPPPADAPRVDDETWLARPKRRRAYRCPSCGARFVTTLAAFCPIDGTALVDAEDTPEVDPLIGALVVGRYRVGSLIGEGGMGKVYRVVDAHGGGTCALKLLRLQVAADATSVARFVQEARIAANVRHENLVEVLDFGEAEIGGARIPYFVMELLDGETLGERIGSGRVLDLATVLDVFGKVSSALGAVHDAGIVHRDLKPENVFLARGKDGVERVKVLDFGVAKLHGGERRTRTGRVFGTPHYMSPEQASGDEVDARTDVYAVGVAMYEALTGRMPFSADTYMGVLTQHVFAAPEPIERVVTDPASLGGVGPVVMRCLEKKRERRFADGSALADALAAVARGEPPPLLEPVPAGPNTTAPWFGRANLEVTRTTPGVALAVVGVACATIIAAIAWVASAPAPSARVSSEALGPTGVEPRRTPTEPASAVSPHDMSPTAAPTEVVPTASLTTMPATVAPATPAASAQAGARGRPGPPARPSPAASASARAGAVSEVIDPW